MDKGDELLLLLFLILGIAVDFGDSGECNSYEIEKLNEGYYKCVYKNSAGIPTIGVGFNLNKSSAREEIESVGADYDKVLSGAECLTDSQIEQLFNKDMNSVISFAKSWISNWSSIGSGPQSAIADMGFDLGCDILQDFVLLKSYIEENDFNGAAQYVQQTLWCENVGRARCDRDVSCFKEGSNMKHMEGKRIL